MPVQVESLPTVRDGFDPTRHAWSQFAQGDGGWIHVANLVLVGFLLLMFAAGLRRIADGGRVTAVLFGAYGLSYVVAGLFRVDPGNGFPPGMDAPETVSTGGLIHER